MKIPELESMLKSGNRSNRYVEHDNILIYVRVTERLIGREITRTLDIANIQVAEGFQNRGLFKKFLQYAEKLAKECERTVYIESVLNPILAEKLPSYGYLTLPHNNFYKTP